MSSPQSSKQLRFHFNEHRLAVPDTPIDLDALRALATPPIASDHDIWRDVDGGKDARLDDDCMVQVGPGDVFYSSGPDGAHPRRLAIVINDEQVIAPAVSLSGEQIRSLVDPPIPASHRLFRDMDGSKDERIGDNEVVSLRYGAEFYSSRPFYIVVNGREKNRDDIEDRDLTFEEVIQLAFDTPPAGAQVTFGITYRNGSAPKPTGILVAGDSVKAKKGMIFNVTATDKS